jgi:hypothetical protein
LSYPTELREERSACAWLIADTDKETMTLKSVITERSRMTANAAIRLDGDVRGLAHA